MIKTFAEAAASVGKAVLLLALPTYLVVDAVRLAVSEGYRERREARQEALCFDLYDEDTNRGDPVAEAARQSALPRSLAGKLDLFLQCATITEIGLAGIKLRQAESTRLAQLDAANAAGVAALEAETQALIDQAFEAGRNAAMNYAADMMGGAGSGDAFQGFGSIRPDFEGAGELFQFGEGNQLIVEDGVPRRADIPIAAESRVELDAALAAAAERARNAFDPATILSEDPAAR